MPTPAELAAARARLEHYANAWCEDADGQAFSVILAALDEAAEAVEIEALIERLASAASRSDLSLIRDEELRADGRGLWFAMSARLRWGESGDTLLAALRALAARLDAEAQP